jgi:sterol desaturase/sphingolipid hydroxylase (fatty acid hydroxylase superfamily)
MAPIILITLTAVFYLIEPKVSALRIPAWRHRHARINLTVAALNVAVLAGIGLATSAVMQRLHAGPVGLNNLLADAGVPAMAATALIVLLYDYLNYWIHRSQHQVNALWPLHRIHHSDPYLDVTSAFRFHPFESLYRAVIQSAGIVVLGMTPPMISLYLVIVVCALLFSHANIRLPAALDRPLSLVLVTPDMHRVHHSHERRWHDSNYGIACSVWDRLHGTFTAPALVTDLIIGHDQYPEAEKLTVAAMLADPLQRRQR